MTERERWVVYPLLFLALGAALRDKFIDRTTAKSIKCEELLVVDEQPLGQEVLLARIGRVEPPQGSSTVGGIIVNGQLVAGSAIVEGNVSVNGIVNARHYAYQGMVLAPGIHPIVPGAIVPNLMRSIEEAAKGKQPANEEKAKARPEAAEPQSPPANPPPATEDESLPESKSGK